MKKQTLRSIYYKITFKQTEKIDSSDVLIRSVNGIIRISNNESKKMSSAVSPVSLNRAARRNIKKTVIAK